MDAESVLQVESLSVTAGSSGKVLLEGVSFTCKPGDVVFVVGPSGKGKTQLLRQIAALNPATSSSTDCTSSGAVSLGGRTPKTIGIPKWRQAVMYVSQNKPTMKCSPREFLAMVCRFKSHSSQRDQRLALDELALTMDMDPSLMDQDWTSLSGGQAQRAMLAVTLALRPTVVLLDEPTAHLDPNTTLLVEESLKGALARYGISAVVVSHDPGQSQRMATQVIDITQFCVAADTAEEGQEQIIPVQVEA